MVGTLSYPILYDPTATNFDNNGIGILGDCISCLVTEEANGAFELEMQYPMDGIHYADIVDRCIIKAKPNQENPQLFRVYSISKPMSGIVSIYAEHISYDLSGIPVSAFEASSAAETLIGLKNNAVVDCPFTFTTDKSTSAKFAVTVPGSIRSQLGGKEGSILDVYGGEYEFDNYNVILHNSRGMNRGVSIRYGKNLTDIKQDRNCANVATGVYPYWVNSESSAVVELPEKIVNAEGTYGFVKIKMLDVSSNFENEPTADQIRTYTQSYIKANNIGVPSVSLSVSFKQLEQSEEYKGMALLEKVSLFDTVNVEFPVLGVSATAKAVKIVYNGLLDRVEGVTLGSVKAKITDTIANQQADIETNKKKPSLSLVQQISASLAKAIMGASGGSVRLLDNNNDGEPDELYIADDSDPANAKKVWRFNYEGWAASQNGYVGPFEMGATFDDGLLATFVTAAHLIAGTIQSKDGNFFVDLDNGIIDIKAVKEVIDDLASYKEQMSTELEMLADGVTISVTKNISDQLSEGDNNLQEQINEITTNYRFTADGQYIGRTDDEAILQLAAGVVNVLVAGHAMATFDRTGVNAEQVTVKKIHMGDFTLSVSDDGDCLTLA